MVQVNIHQAKANLSHYLDLAAKGEKVIFCKRNVPVAELTPLQIGKRSLGLANGTIWLADDFDTLPLDIVSLYE